MSSVADALTRSIQHRQAGRLVEAEAVLRHALAVDPANAQLLFQLGLVALTAGRYPQAVAWLEQAAEREPAPASFHANLAEAYRLCGDFDAAVRANRRALLIDPRLHTARVNLALAYQAQGNLPEAEQCMRDVLTDRPNDLQPNLVLGSVLYAAGRAAEAELFLRQAVALAPADGLAQVHLGLALEAQQRFDEARAAYETALAINPRVPAAHNNLGNLWREQRRPELAEAHYREALKLSPENSTIRANLGAVLTSLGRHDEAVAHLSLAARQAPDAGTFASLAVPLAELGRLDEAVAAAHRAIELAPDNPLGHANLAHALRGLGRVEEAIAEYHSAVQLSPQDPRAHSNLIYTLNFHPGHDSATIWAEHRRWGQTHADPLTAASPPHANDRSPDRRLRIGYVSAHFKAHAVNFFVEPILAHHDPAEVELFCYANLREGDATTQRLRGYAQHWREIATLSDEQVTHQIRADQIDVLVDLSGHIAGNRLQVFAHKPPAVQVTYIGYQNTTGMTAMDYRLTDDWSDPPGTTEAFHTEQLVRLPQSFFCYQPSADAPHVTPLPALERGYVTFGSFNNFAKVTPQVLAAWAEILDRVPGARLVILADAVPSLVAYVAQSFGQRGIAADRVEVAARRPRADYLELMNAVDLALDPFPFQGHTTTCDALWQGLPVVTLAGATYAQRFGSGALATLGLNELIADSTEQYVRAAVALAKDATKLAELRGSLRQRMTASPLLDHAGFTRRLEEAYRNMWKTWCQGASS